MIKLENLDYDLTFIYHIVKLSNCILLRILLLNSSLYIWLIINVYYKFKLNLYNIELFQKKSNLIMHFIFLNKKSKFLYQSF